MHIDQLIAMIEKMHGIVVNRATLISNLSRYCNAEDTFERTAPNTYALRANISEEIRLVG